MPKTIIFCADGTWNSPDQNDDENEAGYMPDDEEAGRPDPSNVWKLFERLEGTVISPQTRPIKEQEKELVVEGRTVQVAKYLHGVGNLTNKLVSNMAGALGAGVIARIVRGYTFVSRHYEPGDSIILVGFSRGAYTARALADFIATKGLLNRNFADSDRQGAYEAGTAAWFTYRAARFLGIGETGWLAGVLDHDTAGNDFVKVDRIAAVAVWDTVGAMGIPLYNDNHRLDVFQFTSRTLSKKVERGFHAVAMDEMRQDFEPTLWNEREGVTQVLFAGAHSDVGGGYTHLGQHSGLSDIALDWMIKQLAELRESSGKRTISFLPGQPINMALNALGTAHEPWTLGPWPRRPLAPRTFGKVDANTQLIPLHESVFERLGKPVLPATAGGAGGYRPTPCLTCNITPKKGTCCWMAPA